jgi:hypothetical protein
VSRTEEEQWQSLVEFYRDASTQTSSNIRTLSLGGLAFAWAFRVKLDDGTWGISAPIVLAIGFFGLSLALDVIQYLFTSKTINKILERGEDPTIRHADLQWMDRLFWWKVVAACTGVLMIVVFAVRSLIVLW